MTLVLGWPQAIWIVLILVSLIVSIVKDGEPKTGAAARHSAGGTFIAAVLGFLLLYWGGFFGP